MKLRARMWLVLGITLSVILGADLAIAWLKIRTDQRTELEVDVHTIRGILMATRRTYHQQFIKSGLPVSDSTVGFLPAHAMSRISSDYKEWNDNGYRFNNVSDRPRNPANRADNFELAAMAFYRANPATHERFVPIIETNGRRWLHYTAPIWTEGYCLQCHGAEAVAPESIRKAYNGASYDYHEGDLRGVMSIKLPMERYDSIVSERFRSHLITDGVTLLLTFFVLGHFIDRFVLRRIELLRETARRVAAGEHTARVPLQGSDELTELGEDFNRMAASVEGRIIEIRELNMFLEGRIAERTAEIDAAKKEAEASSEAKSAFLSNMSHEIRTPLNAVLGLTHLLRTDASKKQAEQLDKVDTAGKHLLSIVNDILDLSKIEAGKLQLEHGDFRLSELFDHVRSIVVEGARSKGLDIRIDSDGVPDWLRGDVVRLRQAILNYTGNAIKFTNKGYITLSAQLLECQGDELLIRFSVIDTGVGISADHLHQLFNPFTQADVSTTRQFGGTGLGLSITRRLAELMGGQAGAESSLGNGSTFWFTARVKRGHGVLPTAEALPADAEQQLCERYTSARLMLVDDNAVNRDVAIELLHSVGLRADVAEDGMAALELAGRHRYDLVLMDIQMPHLNGLDATRAIRALPGWTDVPILAMTANAFDEDRQAALLAGMNDHIPKPINPEQLFATLLKWLPQGVSTNGIEETETKAATTHPNHDDLLRALLAEIPQLDVTDGLEVFRDNLSGYLRLLRMFVEIHGNDVQRIAELIDCGDFASAKKITHALKGAAGGIGAKAIHALLRDLDAGLKQDDPAATRSATTALAERFPKLIKSLQAVLQHKAHNFLCQEKA